MSRHEGVSCDSCLKGNFRGRRYKCLVCYDYDLCANCYEAGANTTRHLVDHPMQCILTRSDFELYYGGEGVSVEQPQSLTCPYCTRMGFTEATLQEHVAADHPDTSFEVVCPVCASLPGGDPNHVTDDFAGHLTLEHRSGPRDLISFLDEPTSSRHSVRRIPHPSRGVGAPRARRYDRSVTGSNMHFSSSGGLSPSSREGIDPIAELLSQLSGVRRTGAGAGQGSSAPSQLQQLQMQLQLERQQVRAARQQLERLPRRQPQVIGTVSGGVATSGHSATMASVVANSSASNNNAAVNANNAANPANASSLNSQNSMFLLPRCMTSTLSDSQLQLIERESANRSLFAREIVVGTLSQALPELTQQTDIHTPVSASTTTTSSPDTPSASSNAAIPQANKKTNNSSSYSSNQEVKRDQTNNNKLAAQQNSQLLLQTPQTLQAAAAAAAAATTAPNSTAAGSQSQNQTLIGSQNQGLPPNPNAAVNPQNTPIVQTLMHSVLPQPLVLQQPISPAPIRNTGTGTIREPVVAAPAPAYLRGGVGPVSVTGASRRKPVRAVDGRNQSTEPPPPH